MLRTFIVAGASVAFFSVASIFSGAFIGMAAAQETLGIPVKALTPTTPEDIEKQKANDRAYNAALHKIPDKKPAADPWGNIRPSAPATAKNKADNKAN
jgi:hypothetical protein